MMMEVYKLFVLDFSNLQYPNKFVSLQYKQQQMKRIFLTVLFSIIFFGAFAQEAALGFRMGMTTSFMSVDEPDLSGYEVRPRAGLMGGIDVDVPFTPMFSFRPSINFIQKSFLVDYAPEATGDSLFANFRMGIIEIPLNIVVRFEQYKGNFFIGAGPTLAFGVAGKVLTNAHDATDPLKIVWDGKYEPLDDDFHLNRFDIGINLMAGYQMSSGFTITLNYNKGFSNLDPKENASLKTSYLSLNLGFLMNN